MDDTRIQPLPDARSLVPEASLRADTIDAGFAAAMFGVPGDAAVVYHINHPRSASQYLALRSVENHILSLGDQSTDFVVVIHGPGLGLLLDANTEMDRAGMIDVLLLYGVRFVVDRASLTARGLEADALYAAPHLTFVSSAYRYIAEMQVRGVSYVKP